jgi:hypothetical protein
MYIINIPQNILKVSEVRILGVGRNWAIVPTYQYRTYFENPKRSFPADLQGESNEPKIKAIQSELRVL